MTEQRRRQRTPCSFSVQVHAPTEDALLFSYATDVSPKGVFVRASRPLPVGTRVMMMLQQLAGERVSVEGTVVRTRDAGGRRGMGLAFDEPNEEISKKLDRLVERCGRYDEQLTG